MGKLAPTEPAGSDKRALADSTPTASTLNMGEPWAQAVDLSIPISALISAPYQNAPTLGESAKAVNWCVLQPLQVS